jgi:hypothetical protein
VNWTNFFFSLLLSGVSVLLIFLHGEVVRGKRAALALYAFLTGVWLIRIVLTAVYPWSYDWMFAAQITAFTLVFVLLLLPLIELLRRGSRQQRR